jgi:hypothetical protein
MSGIIIFLIIVLTSVIIGAIVFLFGVAPKVGSSLSSLIPGRPSTVDGLVRSDFDPLKVTGENIRQQKWTIRILFVLLPFALYLVASYWVTKGIVVANLKWWAVWLGLIGFGLAISSLSVSVAWKNDKGRKFVLAAYTMMVFFFVIGLGIKMSTNTNPFHIMEKYEVASNSISPTATSSEALELSMLDWPKVTFADNGIIQQSVTKGQTIHIVNLSGKSCDVIVTDVGVATSTKKEWRVPVSGDGELYFKLPLNCRIKYYIEDV